MASHGSPHDGAGADPVLERAEQRARRPAAAIFCRRLRHLRPRQRRRHRARRSIRCSDRLRYYQCRNEQAMVHTAAAFAKMSNRLRTLRLHHVDRPRRDQYGDRRGRRDDQPTAGAAAARRIFANRGAGAGAAAARSRADARHLGQRLLPAGLAVLGSHLPARAAADGAARGDARADLPGRDRRGHAVRCRRTRRPRRSTTRRRCSRSATGTFRGRGAMPPRSSARRRRFAASRAPLIIAGGGVLYSEATEALRHFAEATGIAVCETQAGKSAMPWDHPLDARRDRRDRRSGRQPVRARRRPGHRRRHAPERLHDDVEDGVCESRRAVRRHQRVRARCLQARRDPGRRRRAGRARRARGAAGRLLDAGRLSRTRPSRARRRRGRPRWIA